MVLKIQPPRKLDLVLMFMSNMQQQKCIYRYIDVVIAIAKKLADAESESDLTLIENNCKK